MVLQLRELREVVPIAVRTYINGNSESSALCNKSLLFQGLELKDKWQPRLILQVGFVSRFRFRRFSSGGGFSFGGRRES